MLSGLAFALPLVSSYPSLGLCTPLLPLARTYSRIWRFTGSNLLKMGLGLGVPIFLGQSGLGLFRSSNGGCDASP